MTIADVRRLRKLQTRRLSQTMDERAHASSMGRIEERGGVMSSCEEIVHEEAEKENDLRYSSLSSRPLFGESPIYHFLVRFHSYRVYSQISGCTTFI